MHNSSILFILAAFLFMIILAGCSGGASSSDSGTSTGSVTLTWNPSTTYDNNPSRFYPSGYKIYYGISPKIYDGALDVPLSSLTNTNAPRYTIQNLPRAKHYFAVCAYDTSNIESVLSNEISTIAN